MRCQCIVASGPNAGNQCVHNAIANTGYCGKHSKCKRSVDDHTVPHVPPPRSIVPIRSNVQFPVRLAPIQAPVAPVVSALELDDLEQLIQMGEARELPKLPKLDQMPDVPMDAIISFLDDQSLWNLSQVNHQFNQHTRPFLNRRRIQMAANTAEKIFQSTGRRIREEDYSYLLEHLHHLNDYQGYSTKDVTVVTFDLEGTRKTVWTKGSNRIIHWMKTDPKVYRDTIDTAYIEEWHVNAIRNGWSYYRVGGPYYKTWDRNGNPILEYRSPYLRSVLFDADRRWFQRVQDPIDPTPLGRAQIPGQI